MNKKRYLISFLLILTCIGCSTKQTEKPDTNPPTPPNQEVKYTIDNLTLEEKIGQMLIVSYRSTTMDETLKQVLETNKPGGFILFKENFTNYENTIKFIDDIQSTANIPLFLSIDQEGGKVQRLKDLEDRKATEIPPMQQIGKTNDTQLAYNVGKIIAEELQVFGINMDFAPVLDIVSSEKNTVIGNRSFGENAQIVSDMGISLAKGLEENGVIPVYKHFPGHGSTITDSHYDLPVLEKTKEELLSSELIPFQKAIENHAEVIMIGHLAIPNITQDETPASLSKVLITDLLKTEMGFQGLVVTDALNMGALTKHYSEKEIYELAINAGVDLLLMPTSSTSAIKYIKESIEEGKIKEEQIDRSVTKILKLKSNKITNQKLGVEYLGSKEHQEIINKIEK